jgi:hypothetical protein
LVAFEVFVARAGFFAGGSSSIAGSAPRFVRVLRVPTVSVCLVVCALEVVVAFDAVAVEAALRPLGGMAVENQSGSQFTADEMKN